VNSKTYCSFLCCTLTYYSTPIIKLTIKYIIVQSIDTSEEFFKKLYNDLVSDKEIFDGIEGYWQRTTSSVKRYGSRITGISIEGSVEIGDDDTINYYDLM